MIIENPDLFKSWLTSILEPLCDADPAALAKYVYALVKKDKPVEELREVMVDQLDVFLQHETKPFVEMLFTSLESQEYLKPGREGEARKPSPPPEQANGEKHQLEKHPEENHAPAPPLDPPMVPNGPVRARSPRQRVVVSRGAPPPAPPHAPHGPHAPPPGLQPPHNAHAHVHARPPTHEQTLVKVLPLTELLEEPVDQPPRRRERRTDSLREKEDRRRRRSRSWERRARARRRDEHRHDHRRASRSTSRGRYRNRSPLAVDRPATRSRSRSPVLLRDRTRVVREMERDRMSRDRDHRDRLSRDRDRDRSRDRSRSESRSGSPRPDLRPDMSDAYKRRCRDFDEKGYCMRGDLCQWDHGTDPLVLEDAALTRVLTVPPPVPEYNPLTPDIWCDSGSFPPYPHPHHHSHPPRELIPIPRVRHEPPPPLPGASLPPAPLPRHPPPKKHFEYNRLGHPRPPLASNMGNCTLEVKKIPRGMNDITHLNNHFCKFGKIVNIQVCYDGDPEAALITFASPTDANVAYKSTEAVLNNRFIKVFWHNTENKQENMAPGGQQPPKPGDRNNTQHPMSHNKVLINRDNIKATHDIKQQNDKEKETANGQEPKKEAVKPADKVKQVVEMYRRAQALLQKQLQQQKLLIEKLESGNVVEAQKPVLMEAINSSQEGIEKLRKEVVKYSAIIKQMQDESVSRGLSRLQLSQANVKRPKTREEAEKEILDAEMDMFNKEQAGQDVTELVQKISELKRQMAVQFPVHPTIRRPHARGGRFNTPSRFTRGGLTKMYSVNQSVDHRPRALLISGFEADELDALVVHFSQFGEVISKQVELSVPQLVLQYKCRAHAELAALHGRHYNDRTLSITWVAKANPTKPSGPSTVASPAAPSPPTAPATTAPTTPTTPAPARNGEATNDHTEQVEVSEDALLRFDEEEEDDAEEDRSWRR